MKLLKSQTACIIHIDQLEVLQDFLMSRVSSSVYIHLPGPVSGCEKSLIFLDRIFCGFYNGLWCLLLWLRRLVLRLDRKFALIEQRHKLGDVKLLKTAVLSSVLHLSLDHIHISDSDSGQRLDENLSEIVLLYIVLSGLRSQEHSYAL